MARTEIERTVLPSVLERLTDRDPRTPADPPMSRDESVRRYRASVLRDVEWLLNTRAAYEVAPESLVEVRHSAYAYGLPDTSGLTGGTPAMRAQLARWVEDAIATFEPRLAQVQVEVFAADPLRVSQVHFTLSAMLRMDPSPERVLFDTVLDQSTSVYTVRDTAGAAEPRDAR